jgi:hypothetical protein
MKRKLFIAILVYCLFCFGFIGTVNAKNGPLGFAEIYIADWYVEDDYHPYYLFSTDKHVTINPLEGTSYDKETNTLTINNIKGPYEFRILRMGEDFKIKVEGYNEISNISSSGYFSYTTNINIIGDGTLVINKDKTDEEIPISIGTGNLIVGEDVNLILYAPETSEKENYEPTLIEVYGDKPKQNPIQLKNNQTLDITTKVSTTGRQKEMLGISFIVDPDDDSYDFKIVTKDGKQYSLEKFGEKFYVSKMELLKYNEYYFIDTTDLDTDDLNEIAYEFDSEEKVAQAGYAILTDTMTVNYRTYYEYIYYVLKDSTGKEYAIYSDDSRFVFDFTDDTIKLADGNDYYFLKVNDDIEIKSDGFYLGEEKLSIVYADDYTYLVKGTQLEIRKKETQESKNPKTGDNIITYISLLLTSLFILTNKRGIRKI